MPEDTIVEQVNSGSEDDGGASESTTTPSTNVTMTQAELNDKFAQRADRAARNAIANLISEIGFDNVDGLKEALQDYKQIKDSEKTELELLQTKLEEAQNKVGSLTSQLEASENAFKEYKLRTTVEGVAREQDFLKESLGDVWLLVNSGSKLSEKLLINDDGSVKGAEEVVKEVAKLRPHWIQQKQVRKGAPVGKGTAPPPTMKPGQEPSDEPLVRL